MARKKLKASEFEKDGPHPFGGFGVARAWEKVRLIYRTGQNPDQNPDLDAPPDQWPQNQRGT
jgi:hypothetical protein